MTNSPRFSDATIIASIGAVATLLNSGHIDVYSGTQPAVNGSLTGTRLARLTFSATAFPAATASGGVVTATANTITSDTNTVAGTAGYAALVKSDGTTVVATCSIGTSGTDIVISSVGITSGGTVSCSAFTITESES